MKLLPILFLCFHCFLNDAVPVSDINVDCDDPDIFKAVDEALRSYNNNKEDGKQFVLLRVTDAKKRNDVNDQIHYFIEYEIQEGSCTVKSKDSWQACQFQANKPDWGKCSAHLLVNNEEKSQTVVSQKCSMLTVALGHHGQCFGCPHSFDPNSKEILHAVHTAIDKMNRQGSHLYHYGLDRIVKVTRQMLLGWEYIIHYVVRKTNCSKIDFKTQDSEKCKLDVEGETGECDLHVNETPDGRMNNVLLACTSQAGVCLGCPLTVDHDDPELLNLLSKVIDEYNSNINATKLHKLSRVVKATKQGFHEQIYHVEFVVMPTNCSKPDYTILGDECNNEENAKPLTCDTTINATDKSINFHSAPQCNEKKIIMMPYSGLSPLKEQQSRGKKSSHHKGHKSEQKGKPGRKPHREHKYDHKDESSEEVESESKVNVKEETAALQQVPNLSAAEPNVPSKDTEETSKLEPSAVPKCPGKLWQPKSQITH
ncbi:T-kininogen 1-like [Pyxicephalus adspersus]|uniref:T-kininogen 1-like n=1 Tax=Pyxicephalus adspersus TaxID=30357 RepID=UPI003B5C31C1